MESVPGASRKRTMDQVNMKITCSGCQKRISDGTFFMHSCFSYYCSACAALERGFCRTCSDYRKSDDMIQFKYQQTCSFSDMGCTGIATFKCTCIPDGNLCHVHVTEVHSRILADPCTPVPLESDMTKEQENKAACVPVGEAVKTFKVHGKNQISIGGKINLPLQDFGKVINVEKPSLVISRIMRLCISSVLKKGCEINDRVHENNFIFRIGSSELEGEERLRDGQEKIDTLIRYAHQIKDHNTIPLQSYRDCMGQIQKALYDFNRRNQQKTKSLEHEHECL